MSAIGKEDAVMRWVDIDVRTVYTPTTATK